MMQEQNSNQISLQSHSDLESAGEYIPIVNAIAVFHSKEEIISEKRSAICAKICAIMLVTISFSPFVICDLYFALTDTSCINQPIDKIQLNMRTYLLVCAIIGIVSITFIDVTILLCDYENFELDTNNILLKMFDYVYKLFTLAWLIVGCVLFWNLMDTSICTHQVYSYLLARFILMIISFAMLLLTNEKKK
jgi:hypothetical protein